MAPNPVQVNENEYESSLSMASLVGFLLAVALGTLGAVVLLPRWVPSLAQSLIGSDPKAYWYLSRGSAFVALSLLWISMSLGLLITNKIARTWPGAPAAFALHEYVSLLGLAFAIFHALVLMGDHYINFNLAELLVPFAATNYHPNWVGLGQVGFYVWVILAGSFYVRQYITQKVWRVLHFASFATFLVALFHGLTSGTDSSLPWAQSYYWFIGGSLIFLLIYRIVSTLFPEKKPIPPARPAAPQQQRPITSPAQPPNPPTVPNTEAVVSRPRVVLHPATVTSADAARPSLPAVQQQPQRAAPTPSMPTDAAVPSHPPVTSQQKSRLATLLQGETDGFSLLVAPQQPGLTSTTLKPRKEVTASPIPATLQQPNPEVEQQPRPPAPIIVVPSDKGVLSQQVVAHNSPRQAQAALAPTEEAISAGPLVAQRNPASQPQQPSSPTLAATDVGVPARPAAAEQLPSQKIAHIEQIQPVKSSAKPGGAGQIAPQQQSPRPATLLPSDVPVSTDPMALAQTHPAVQSESSSPAHVTVLKTDKAESPRSVSSQQKLRLANLLQDAVLPPRPVTRVDPPTPPAAPQNNVQK